MKTPFRDSYPERAQKEGAVRPFRVTAHIAFRLFDFSSFITSVMAESGLCEGFSHGHGRLHLRLTVLKIEFCAIPGYKPMFCGGQAHALHSLIGIALSVKAGGEQFVLGIDAIPFCQLFSVSGK